GIHIYVRISPDHGFGDLRRAALAFAREVERRAPDDVTTTWWRKDRDPAAVFVDYNQNARDHTMAAAYSVRGFPDARVSTPITWEEIDDVEPAELNITTVPKRFAKIGDLHAGIDEAVFSIDPLLEWAARDEHAGVEDPGEPDHPDERPQPFDAGRKRVRARSMAGSVEVDAWRVLPPKPYDSLAGYIEAGGGVGLTATDAVERDTIVEELVASGLRGRGGAGFPTGVKWRTIRAYASSVLR